MDVARLPQWVVEMSSLHSLLFAANVGALYLLFRSWWRGTRPPIETWRAVCFCLGVTIIALAGVAQATVANDTLSSHVFHHAVLAFVAPPLLLLGRPGMVLTYGSPPTIARFLLVYPRHGIVGRFLRLAFHPFVCLIGFCIIIYAWQVPQFYEAARRWEAIHSFQHFLWLLAGLVFWWHVVDSGLSRPRMSREFQLGYLFAGACVAGLPGAFLLLSNQIMYPSHASQVSPVGLAPLEDQIVGGLLLLVIGKASLGIGFTIMFFRMFRQSDEGPSSHRQRRGVPPL
jgi:putative membrane protein